MMLIQLSLSSDEGIAFVLDIHADSQSPSSRVDDIRVTLSDKLNDILNSCVKRNVRYVFFAGDIFNRVACPHETVNMLGSIFLKFKSRGMELFSILGNHDIVRNNLDAMEKSPIQTLFSFGVLTHISLSNFVVINKDIKITPVDYTEYPIEADKSYKKNILLAHMFYKTSELIADAKHNLSEKDVGKLGYDMMVLGHDHCEYPVVKQGKTYIHRFGSVLRGSSHDYNFTRVPKFMVVKDIGNLCEDGTRVEYVGIKHRSYETIASEYVITKKNFSDTSGLQDILSNLADKLAESGQSDGDRIFDIIKNDTNLPNDCRDLLLRYINESV